MTPDELKERTKKFALRSIQLCNNLPRTGVGQVISRQLLRAATSVGANYRAACRARSAAEFAAKIGIVEEEADECGYWLELVVDAKLMDARRVAALRKEAGELTAIASASRKTTRSRVNRKSEIGNRKSRAGAGG